MKENWIGNLAGSESSWQGKDGFKNKGWPTIKNTAGVLGTIISGGAYGTFVGTSAWGTGATIWNTTSLGVGAYNTVDGLSNGAMPASDFMNSKVGLGIDAWDARSMNPLGIMNMGIRYVDYSLR